LAGTYCHEDGINMVAKYVSSFAATKRSTATHAVCDAAVALAEGSLARVGCAVDVALAVVIEGAGPQPVRSAVATTTTVPVDIANGSKSIADTSSTPPLAFGQQTSLMKRVAPDAGYGIGAMQRAAH
jgi:hypothetical protein